MQLEVEELTIGYDGRAVAKDISFIIEDGDYLCIVGDNGTGKSTLLKTILGLHQSISGFVDLAIPRKEIGYLPQQTDIQKDFPASVKEVVLSGCLNASKWWKPFYTKEEKIKATQALQKTNVADLEKKCYREISGGQQQRVLLARALLTTQKMIFLDEPTAGLDPDSAKDFYAVLHKINKDDKITIIMVSHDVENAIKNATHILHLKKDSYSFSTVKEYKK